MNLTSCINTSHELARELLNKPDSFITAIIGDKEYVVDGIKRIATHANIDDSVMNWSLILRDCGQGNIKR